LPEEDGITIDVEELEMEAKISIKRAQSIRVHEEEIMNEEILEKKPLKRRNYMDGSDSKLVRGSKE
jgi:hypothetical protein